MRVVIDANIFIRYLAGDDPIKAERSFGVFERARRNDIELFLLEAIICEVVYVLSSRRLYAKPRKNIADELRRLLGITNVVMDYKPTVLAALERYATSTLDFEDCLAIEHARRMNLDGVLTYDEKIGRDGSVVRLEP